MDFPLVVVKDHQWMADDERMDGLLILLSPDHFAQEKKIKKLD